MYFALEKTLHDLYEEPSFWGMHEIEITIGAVLLSFLLFAVIAIIISKRKSKRVKS